MKQCTKCKKERPLDQFGEYRGRIQTRCIMCRREYGRKYAAAHREKMKVNHDRWVKENNGHFKSYRSIWKKANRELGKISEEDWREAHGF